MAPHHLQTATKRVRITGTTLPVLSPYVGYTLTGSYLSTHTFSVHRVDELRAYASRAALRRDIPRLYIITFEQFVRRGEISVRPHWFPPMSRARHYLYFEHYKLLWKLHDDPAVWGLDSRDVQARTERFRRDPVLYCFSRVPPFPAMVPLSKAEPFLIDPIPALDRQAMTAFERLVNDTIYHEEADKTSIPVTGIPKDVLAVLCKRDLVVVHDGQVTARFVHETLEAIQRVGGVVLTNEMPRLREGDVVVDAATDDSTEATKVVVTNGSALDAERYLQLLRQTESLVVVGDPRSLRAPRPRWGMPPLPVPTTPLNYEHVVATDDPVMDLKKIYDKTGARHCLAEPSKLSWLNHVLQDLGVPLRYRTPGGKVSGIRSVFDVPPGKKRGTTPVGGVGSPIPSGLQRHVLFANKERTTLRRPTLKLGLATDLFFGDPVARTVVFWTPGLTRRHLQTVANRTTRKMIVLAPEGFM